MAPTDIRNASSPNEGLAGWPEGSPWHAGEQALQARAGVRERMELAGRRVIRDFMPEQHREFFPQLPFVIVGSLDEDRRPWASMLVGQPGFIATPDPRLLTVAAAPLVGDPLTGNLREGAAIGMLGIQLETRRRNRANGTILSVDPQGFVMRVSQSFGNCPQYIQARQPFFVSGSVGQVTASRESALLSTRAAALIRGADTLFIATAAANANGIDPVHGVDVSHRGGKPGFIRLGEGTDRSVLTIPDFAGNNFFNTLGNIAANPRAGLLFVDFSTGDILSLTGEARVIWDGPEVTAFVGAQRLLRFHVQDGIWLGNSLPLRWSAPDMAPQLAKTGSWTGDYSNGSPT